MILGKLVGDRDVVTVGIISLRGWLIVGNSLLLV